MDTSSWDPGPAEKEWYLHSVSGDRGWKVRRSGRWFVHLDRPQQVIERPFNDDWRPDVERRPLTRFAITQVAFDADKRLCASLGMHDKSKADWLSLSQEQRVMWMERGPKMPEVRAELYAAIMGVLKPLAK